MPRQARIDVADTVYHITCRGDRREPIYRDDADRRSWLRMLGEVCKRHHWRVYAFCQMSNHFHLVVEPSEATLSVGMRDLNSMYTQRFNARHDACGHVFQGRFHSEIVRLQSHMLELMRYVVLNPVRAGMVATPGSWPWSSYTMTCDATFAPSWLETEWVLSQFSDRHAEAVAAYRRFVADGCASMGQAPAEPVPPSIDCAGR
jgi:putative transposase